MRSKPVISIVIAFFNAEKFICETFGSVFQQTYTNWELLLVDDGSTDGSTEMALRWVAQYPERVSYLKHPGHQNLGTSAARNLGISRAQGEYIALLDADDIWLPQKLEHQLRVLQSHPEADMTYGPGQWWYSWTGEPEDCRHDFVQTLGVQLNTLIKPPSLLPIFLEKESTIPLVGSSLIRRKVIEEIGGWEEAFRTLYDDQVFYAKICLQASVVVTGECYCKYRKHADSLCANMKRTRQHKPARLIFLTWLEDYLLKQQVNDSSIWKGMQEQLSRYRSRAPHNQLKSSRLRLGYLKTLAKRSARNALPRSFYAWLKLRLQHL